MESPPVTTPPACASPDGAPSLRAPTPAAGAQTGRVVITAVADGTGSHPSHVVVTIGGVAHTVDVTPDRDDWELPDCETVDALRVLWAIDDAVERYLVDADDGEPRRRIERVWARAVAS